MYNLNDTFLEEFKRLDKLCKEMYRSDKGITSYIEDMKHVSPYESRCIPNWDFDLKQLTNLRHLRNRLTHDVGTLNINMCTQSDINWLHSFYGRIFNQTDPIALLCRNKREQSKQLTNLTTLHQIPYTYGTPQFSPNNFFHSSPQQTSSTYRTPPQPKHSTGARIVLYIIAGVAIGGILAAILITIICQLILH